MPTPLVPPDPPLSDGVVTLRPFRDTDADAIAAMMDDPEIARWTSRVPSPYARRDAVMWLATLAASIREGRSMPLAAVDAQTGELIGSFGIEPSSDGRAELGYSVARSARRRGVATRGLTLVSGYCFDVLGLERLELFIQPGNVASLAVAERAGYRREGLLRSRIVTRGGRVDAVLMALLREEWRGS